MLLITILWLSFVEGAPGDPELGYTFENYAAIFGDPFTYRVIRNTFAFLIVTLIVSFSLGLPIAWLIERTDFPGKPVVFTLMTVALLIPGFAVALGWVFLLHPRIGVINSGADGAVRSEPGALQYRQHRLDGRGRRPQPDTARLHHDVGRACARWTLRWRKPPP